MSYPQRIGGNLLTACQMVAATVMLALPFNTLLMSLVFYLVGKWPGEGRGPLRCVCHAEVSSMGFNGVSALVR